MPELEFSAAGVEPVPDAELVLAHLDSLPTLPPVAITLLQVTSDADSATADVVKCLRADQSLTAKVLAVAGSAAIGVREPAKTLEQAVVLLGFATIRSIVLAVKVFECFPRPGSASTSRAFDRVEFWKHALGVACAARRTAQANRKLNIDPEDAFVAGLLHDIGKVALDAVFPKAYERIAARSDRLRADIADCERALLGTDHTLAGRRIAERWGLPRTLREVIWLHHLVAEAPPASVSHPRLIALVQWADTFVREQRIGYSGNHVFYESAPAIARRIGLTDGNATDLVQAVIADVTEQATLLGLDRETPEELYVRAQARANEELGRLNAELLKTNRRLAASARYFRAITQFDRQLTAQADLAAVVAAAAAAATIALQRTKVAAFGVRESSAAADVGWVGGDTDESGSRVQALPADLVAGLREPGDWLDTVVTRLPPPLTALLEPALPTLGTAEPWLIPIVHDGQVAGGIVYTSESDERTRLAPEADDLRSFLASLGLALGRANAQTSARRLSDDLADANRRLQQTQLALVRSRTLSMIAEMAAGAGHELNNPLAVISGRAQMLRERIDDPDARRWLALIEDKAHECSRIVDELMDFAQPRESRLVPVDLAELLAELRAEWLERAKLPASRFVLAVGALPETDLPVSIEGDAAQLRIVFTELISNAVFAIAEGGTIAITCRAAPSGDYVEAVVRDSGCGMDGNALRRAFDPFFSHRRAGRGRGLGLARAYRIVETHRGRIWLESRPGEGTEAHLILPRTRDARV